MLDTFVAVGTGDGGICVADRIIGVLTQWTIVFVGLAILVLIKIFTMVKISKNNIAIENIATAIVNADAQLSENLRLWEGIAA